MQKPERQKITHLSYSSIEKYQKCPKRFELTRILRVGEHPSWASVGGTAIHTASEWFDHMVTGVDGSFTTQDGDAA